jgi:hypothetical protein
VSIDLVTVFAIIVFSVAWFFWSRTPKSEPLVRLFFGTLMTLGALIGVLGYVLRLLLTGSA